MSDRPGLEVELYLTPGQRAAGGEYPLTVRHGRARVQLMVTVPAGMPEDGVLRLTDIPVGDRRYDLYVRPVVREPLPSWPVTLLGAGLFLTGWLRDRAPAWMFGGVILLGMGLYARITGRMPIAGRRTQARDLLFLMWLIVVAMALVTWLHGLQ